MWSCAAIAAAIVGVVVVWPAGIVVRRIAAGLTARAGAAPVWDVSFDFATFLNSLAWAALIAGIAVVLGWPMAWGLRRWGWRWAPVLMAPMLLPPYLAYAGWNLLRAPDTWLGAVLERFADHGHRWVPVATGRVLAVAGLGLWAAPLAAIVIGLALQRVDESVLEQLRVDAAAGWSRWMQRARLARSGLIGAFLMIGVVMLGSAVPVHLAQIPTWSINLWKALDLTPSGEQWRVWAVSWPMVVVAAVSGWIIARAVEPGTGWAQRRERAGPMSRHTRRSALATWIASLGVWGLGVAGPWALFAANLRGIRPMWSGQAGGGSGLAVAGHSIVMFWRVSGGAVLSGLVIAGAIAIVASVLLLALRGALTGGPGPARWGRVCVALLLLAALLPGILVGSAVAGAWNDVRVISDSAAVVVLAHLARFGAIPALAACWLAGVEPREERDLRAADGVAGWRGWLAASWPLQAGVVCGAALAIGVLSFFEIEATVVVQPAGVDNLSRQILGYLHFARTEELCAAGVVLIGAGLIAALAAARLVAAAARIGGRLSLVGPRADEP